MKIFNKIAALALVVAGFTACNEAEDFDRYADHTYSNAIELGHFTSLYDANSKYTYGAVITLNAEGDTILYMYSTGKEGNNDEGKTRTLFTADTLNYDQKTGVVTAKADTSYYDEGETFSTANALPSTSPMVPKTRQPSSDVTPPTSRPYKASGAWPTLQEN